VAGGLTLLTTRSTAVIKCVSRPVDKTRVTREGALRVAAGLTTASPRTIPPRARPHRQVSDTATYLFIASKSCALQTRQRLLDELALLHDTIMPTAGDTARTLLGHRGIALAGVGGLGNADKPRDRK
jgi:hypothetical protein